MSKSSLLLVLLLCSPLWATSYYVANAGSDAANGTSTGTPWQTVAHVNAQTFSPGDSIFFNRGDQWRESLVPPSSGSIGNVITFGAYGSGAKPILNGTKIETGWSVFSGSIYSKTVAQCPICYLVFQDGTALTKVASTGVMAAGTWSVSGTTLFVETLDDSAPSGHTIEVTEFPSSQNNGLVDIVSKSYVTIDSLDLQKSNWVSFYLRTASNVTLQNFSCEDGYWNCVSPDEQYSGNNFLFTASDHINVLNGSCNNIGRSRLPSPYHAQEGVCVEMAGIQTGTVSGMVVTNNLGEGITALDGASNIVFSLNHVSNNKFAGIYMLGGPKVGDTTNITLWGNLVDNVPNATPAYAMAVEAANGCAGGTRGCNLDGVVFEYNLSNCNNTGAYYAMRLGGGGGNGVFQNLLLYGNTLVGCQYGIANTDDGDSGPGNVISNNIVAPSNFQAINNTDKSTSNYAFSNNILFTPFSSVIRWWNGSAYTVYTLAAFLTAFPCIPNGWFCNSSQVDPKFTNSAGGDFTLLTASPAIDAGLNLGSTYQNALDPRTGFPWSTLDQNAQGAGWEIGAFVYFTTAVPVPPVPGVGLFASAKP